VIYDDLCQTNSGYALRETDDDDGECGGHGYGHGYVYCDYDVNHGDGVDCDDGFWMKYLTLRMELRHGRNHQRTEAGGSDNHSRKVGGWGGTSQADVRA